MTMAKHDEDEGDPMRAVPYVVIGFLIVLACAAVFGVGSMLVDLYLVPGE
jgi:hypothetical protein